MDEEKITSEDENSLHSEENITSITTTTDINTSLTSHTPHSSTTLHHDLNTIEKLPSETDSLDDTIRLALNDPDFPTNISKRNGNIVLPNGGYLLKEPAASMGAQKHSRSESSSSGSSSGDGGDEYLNNTSMGYMPLPQDPDDMDTHWSSHEGDGVPDNDGGDGNVDDSLQCGFKDSDGQEGGVEKGGVCDATGSPAEECISKVSKLKEGIQYRNNGNCIKSNLQTAWELVLEERSVLVERLAL